MSLAQQKFVLSTSIFEDLSVFRSEELHCPEHLSKTSEDSYIESTGEAERIQTDDVQNHQTPQPMGCAPATTGKSILRKFPVHESSVRALGRLLLYQVRMEPSNTSAHLATLTSLVLAMQDDSSEVRRRALSTVKTVSKANPQAVIIHTSLFGPVLAECLKDGSTPVRLAAERCALHSFQLVEGTESVQAAQKYITGLDARRISKLPEYSDDSEDEPTSPE